VNFSNPAWRRRPIRTAFRVAWSLVLKRRPPSRPLVVPFDDGRSRIYADLRTTFGLYLYRYGGCDYDRLLVRRFLRPGDVFVDGGAHVGMFSLVAAAAVGATGSVYAFEPSPETYAGLEANVALNGFGNVRAHQEALAAEDGILQFTVFDGDTAAFSSVHPGSDVAGGRTIDVASKRLADRVPQEVWPRIAMLKLDVEGAELDALRGAEPLLDAVHPVILMEFVPGHFKAFGVDPRDVLAFLTDKEYRLLRPSADPEVWRPCSFEKAMHLDAERPNLLATVSVERLRERGVGVVSA